MASRRFHIRAFISLFVLLSALVITLAGVMLFLSPPGRIANWTGWRMLGLTKTQWQGVHTVFALLFVVAAGLHTYLNWRVLLSYLHDRVRGGIRRGRELALACLATLLVFTLTLRGAPPFSTVLALGERLSYSWDVPEVQPPVPGAEQLHLDAYAAAVGLDPAALAQRVDSLGLGSWGPDRTLEELAASLGFTPRELAERLDVRAGGAGGAGRGGRAGSLEAVGAGEGGTGYGRVTVAAFCAEQGISVPDAVGRLGSVGITARGSDRIRAIASESGLEPAEIVRIMRGS